MAKIENPKTYTGRDLETIFFRPMLTGPDAAALGIKIMYNMPVPTTCSSGNGPEIFCRNIPPAVGTAAARHPNTRKPSSSPK